MDASASIDMIGIGERSGSLREMLDEVAVFYDARSEVRPRTVDDHAGACDSCCHGWRGSNHPTGHLPPDHSINLERPGITASSLNEPPQVHMKEISDKENGSPFRPLDRGLRRAFNAPEMKAAKELARRYRLPFVDLLPPDRESPIDYNLFTEVPVD
jgi:hypothetical protein